MVLRAGIAWVVATGCMIAQTAPAPSAAAPNQTSEGWRPAEPATQGETPGQFVVQTGTKIPLSLLNSVSTKHSGEGDRVYLETMFPILVGGRVVIPPGSYVAGTVTEVKRPGRVKGRGELYLRFDSLTLPNGVTRDFRARVGAMDGRSRQEMDRSEGKIKGEGDKGGDARKIGEATAGGASVGTLAGAASGHYGMGAGIGAAAGAGAGLMRVLLSSGPGVVLAKGTTLEMVLDRPIAFTENELYKGPLPSVGNSGRSPSSENSASRPRSRFPF